MFLLQIGTQPTPTSIPQGGGGFSVGSSIAGTAGSAALMALAAHLRPTFSVPTLPFGSQQKQSMGNAIYGPQNIDPNGLSNAGSSFNGNALLGGSGALTNYQNSQRPPQQQGGQGQMGSMLQGGGQQQSPYAPSRGFQDYLKSQGTSYDEVNARSQAQVEEAKRNGTYSPMMNQGPDTFQQQGGQQSPQGFNAGQTFSQMFNDPNVTMNYNQQGGQQPGGQPDLQSLVHQYGGNQLIAQMAANGLIPGGGQGPMQDAGAAMSNMKGNFGQDAAALNSAGYEQSKLQNALQTGGYATETGGVAGANAFGTGVANTIGNVNDLSGQAMGQNQGNVSALRDAIYGGQNQFQNYFQQNLGNPGANFDQARSAMAGASPYIGQAANIGNQNAQMGQGVSTSAMGDTAYMRQLLNQDRAQRDAQMQQSQGFNISPGMSGFANDVYNANIASGQTNLNTGPQGEQFRQAQQDAQNSMAARGLGPTSSPFADAAGRIQMQKDAMNQQLVQGELARRSQSMIDEANLNKQLAMQGAGLTNQSSVAFAGNLPALYNSASGGINASTAAGGLVDQAANSQIQMARGIGDIGAQQANAANQGAQTMLQGNQLTQQGLNNAGQLSNAGNQLGLNSLLQGGQLGNQGMSNMTQLGQLGMNTQDQGFNQQQMQLQDILQRFNNVQKLVAINKATQAGGSLSI